MEQHCASTRGQMTYVSFDNAVLPVGANTTKGMCLIAGIATCNKFAFCKDAPIFRVDVIHISAVARSEFFIAYLRDKSLFASLGLLMIDPNVFGGLVYPYCRVGVASFGGFAAGERNVTGDAGFHGVNGNKVARIWVDWSNGVGCTVVGVLLCVSEFASKANGDWARAYFDGDVEASVASPGLYVLEATMTEAMV